MSIEAIQEEIISEKSKLGEEQIGSAIKKANEIKEDTLRIISEENKKTEDETRSLILQLKNVLEASVKFEIKKIELKSKKEIINQVFEKASDKIRKLDDRTQERLTNILLNKAREEIDVKSIICNERTSKWIPKGITLKIEDILGGIIAENEDGTLRVDNSYETILEEVRKDALKKIAKNIF